MSGGKGTTGGYKLVGIRGSLTIDAKRLMQKPPSDAGMVAWGKKLGCDVVIRYWPSKKGWRLLDIRKAQIFDTHNSRGQMYPKLFGAERGNTFYPSENAAIMAALHLLNAGVDIAH